MNFATQGDKGVSHSAQAAAGADVATVFGFGDDLCPAKVIHIHEEAIGLHAVLVVDNVAAGPAIGGLRMAGDVTTQECARLARAMTLKNAAAGLPHGGAKSIIKADPKTADRNLLVRGFACAIRGVEDYIVGPDMGTDEMCMGWVRDEIGRAVGLPKSVGGIPLDELGATGWGLSHAIRVALPKVGCTLAGARVVIQGFGAVGYHTARFVAQGGAKIIAASDSQGAIANAAGLDVDALRKHKQTGAGVASFAGGKPLDSDALIDVACDIWVPAARPDVITERNVERLQAKLVAQGANIPVTLEAEKRLHARGILSLPDFIANAGGVICAAMEYHGATESAAFQAIEDKITRNVAEVLARTERDRVLPRDAATSMALQRVHDAMKTRRWHTFY
jgi:glutamate dehydrogenase (NAD(P)+)